MPDETPKKLPQDGHLERFDKVTRPDHVPTPEETRQLIEGRFQDRKLDADKEAK